MIEAWKVPDGRGYRRKEQLGLPTSLTETEGVVTKV